MKKTLVLSLIFILCLSMLCSCGITDLFTKDSVAVTKAVGTKTTDTSSTPASENTTAEMDFVGKDLSEYIELDYKGLEFKTKYERRTITDEILDAEIEDFIKYYGLGAIISSGITTSGATINMDYVGMMDGVAFEGGSSENQKILLDDDESGFIPGFASGLIGKEVGTTVVLNLTFPDTYYASLAGKAVTFLVTINGIYSGELTDEIASSASGGEYTTIAGYREYYKNYLEELDVYLQYSEVGPQVFDKLNEIVTVKKYPEQQVQHYYEEVVIQLKSYAEYYGMTYEACLDTLGYTEETIRKQAENFTLYDLMLYYIANKEDAVLSEDDYKAYLQDMVNTYKQRGYSLDADYIEQYYANNYGDTYLWDQAQEEKVCDIVFQYATVIYDPDFVLETD